MSPLPLKAAAAIKHHHLCRPPPPSNTATQCQSPAPAPFEHKLRRRCLTTSSPKSIATSIKRPSPVVSSLSITDTAKRHHPHHRYANARCHSPPPPPPRFDCCVCTSPAPVSSSYLCSCRQGRSSKRREGQGNGLTANRSDYYELLRRKTANYFGNKAFF